jgi:cytochrome c
MNGFELNKIAGAVFAALLTIFGMKTTYEIVGQEKKSPGIGMALPKAAVAAVSPTAAAFDFKAVAALMPNAKADAGQEGYKKCAACHTANKGGDNRVGPNLWNVVGRGLGAAPGFAYSEALKAKGGAWTWEALGAYLNNPRTAIPGNKMAFAGISDNQELADMLVYLRTLADQPAELPK